MIVDDKGRPLKGGEERREGRPEKKMMRASDAFGLSTTPDWNTYTGRNMLVNGYERNLWVYRCSTARQNAASEAPLLAQVKRGDDWEWAPGNRLNELLANPCEGLGASDFVKMIIAQLDIQGSFNAKLVYGGKGGNKILEVWPLEIGTLAPVVKDGELLHYRYTPRGRSHRNLAPEEVLRIRMPHPDSQYIGMSPLMAAGRSVDMDNEAGDWQKTSMQNRGVPDGVFELTGDVDVDEWREARRVVRETYTGAGNAREPYVMANAKFHQMSLTPVEMDFINSRKMTREEICAAYGVPLPIAGVLEDATLANLDASRKVFWRETMVPLLADIQGQMNRQLVKDDNVRLKFDLANISALRESYEEKIKQAERLWKMGVPLDKINKRLELDLDIEGVPGTDMAWAPTGLAPVEQAASGGGGDVQAVSEIAQAVADGNMGREAAAKLLARRIDWLNEEEALDLLDVEGGEE